MKSTAPLGLIAGKGELPRIVCKTAQERGIPVVAVTFEEDVLQNLQGLADVHLHPLGKAGKTIKLFKDSGAKKIVFIGKFEKRLAFSDLALDATGMKIMAKMATKSDSSFMLTIIEEFETRGLEVEKQTDWLPGLLPEKGILGKRRPSTQVTDDFDFGFKICRELADKDIGQTVIVKEGVVVAVEAVEGTDAAIDRGCRLAGKGAVMVKCSRPNQDFRFDIPSVGVNTVQKLAEHKAAGLAVEAGRTVAVNMPEVVSICDRAGITFLAM